MSTIKTTNIQNPSAASPSIVLASTGNATYAATHDFTAATVTGAGEAAARVAAIAHAKSLGFTDAMIAVMYPNLGSAA